MNTSDLDVRVHAYGVLQGRQLAAIGVTVNLSPVLDLQSDREPGRLDCHSLIERRAISSDPSVVARTALACARGLEQEGVAPTLKHFPGLGRVTNDTHHFSARLGVPITELESRDWLPFRTVARNSNALIMLGHVVLSKLDPRNPASFSKVVVDGVLRRELKHDGLLITDDLTMGAAYAHGLCNVTVKGLNAGVDFLLVSYDHEKIYGMLHCAHGAHKHGQLDTVQLERSHCRIAAFNRREKPPAPPSC